MTINGNTLLLLIILGLLAWVYVRWTHDSA